MRFSVSDASGQFTKEMQEARQKLAAAVTATIHEAGALAIAKGRSNIASAGFSARWQTGLDVKYFPSGNKPSLNAFAVVYHKIGLATVFEEGRTIVGKPLLWLPIEKNLPPASGRRWTPRRYAQLVGPLRSVRLPGHRPLLVSAPRILRDQAAIRRLRLRNAAPSRGGVPMFVGIDSVTIRRRFEIARIVDEVRALLPEIFNKHIQ